MVIGSIFLILALAIVVSLYIFFPLLERAGPDELMARQEVQTRVTLRSTLLSERDRLLNALLELEADNELGKIPQGEYAPHREKMVREAAETLRRLDEMNLSKDQISKSSSPQTGDDDLEELIALRRQELSVSDKGSVDSRTDNPPNNSADGGTGTAAFQACCKHCGNPLMQGDKFCSVCGRKVMF